MLGPGRIGEVHVLEGDRADAAAPAGAAARRRAGWPARRRGSRRGARPRRPPGPARHRPPRAARASSPRTPRRARIATAARPVMSPASTSCAPYQSTPTTLAETRKIAVPVRNARALVEARAASKASSAARGEALAVGRAPCRRPAWCGRRRPPPPHRRRRRRAGPARRASAGARRVPTGPAAARSAGSRRRTRADSFGLVQIIRAMAPTNRKALRSAIEMLAPKADLTCVVSAVSRETISPLWSASKKAGSSRVRWREHRRCADRRRPARRA